MTLTDAGLIVSRVLGEPLALELEDATLDVEDVRVCVGRFATTQSHRLDGGMPVAMRMHAAIATLR